MPNTGDRTAQASRRSGSRHSNNDGLIPVLARRVREVESKATTGKKLGPTNRTKFQVIALLMREERGRAKSDPALSDSARAEQLKRLDGIATILAKTAARDTSLISLLESTAPPSPAAQKMRRDWLLESGAELEPDDLIITTEAPKPKQEVLLSPELAQKQVIPQSVRARQLSNPFLAPDYEAAAERIASRARRLAGWELLEPLFRSFEKAAPGEPAKEARCGKLAVRSSGAAEVRFGGQFPAAIRLKDRKHHHWCLVSCVMPQGWCHLSMQKNQGTILHMTALESVT